MLRSIDESCHGVHVIERIDHGQGIRTIIARGPGYRRRGETGVDYRYEVLTDCAPPDRRLLDGAAMDRAGARRVAQRHAAQLREVSP